MEPFAVAAFAFALIVLLRRPGVFSPAFVLEGAARDEAPTAPGDEDDQLPETDRAPRRRLLWAAVLGVALVRIALLVTLHA
jgi:hypothetical protein